jgi:hypothetical protein
MAYRNDQLRGDPDVLLGNLRDEVDELIKTWDHARSGGDGRSNKQIYLLAQRALGRDASSYAEAKGTVLLLVANRYLLPGTQVKPGT